MSYNLRSLSSLGFSAETRAEPSREWILQTKKKELPEDISIFFGVRNMKSAHKPYSPVVPESMYKTWKYNVLVQIHIPFGSKLHRSNFSITLRVVKSLPLKPLVVMTQSGTFVPPSKSSSSGSLMSSMNWNPLGRAFRTAKNGRTVEEFDFLKLDSMAFDGKENTFEGLFSPMMLNFVSEKFPSGERDKQFFMCSIEMDGKHIGDWLSACFSSYGRAREACYQTAKREKDGDQVPRHLAAIHAPIHVLRGEDVDVPSEYGSVKAPPHDSREKRRLDSVPFGLFGSSSTAKIPSPDEKQKDSDRSGSKTHFSIPEEMDLLPKQRRDLEYMRNICSKMSPQEQTQAILMLSRSLGILDRIANALGGTVAAQDQTEEERMSHAMPTGETKTKPRMDVVQTTSSSLDLSMRLDSRSGVMGEGHGGFGISPLASDMGRRFSSQFMKGAPSEMGIVPSLSTMLAGMDKNTSGLIPGVSEVLYSPGEMRFSLPDSSQR